MKLDVQICVKSINESKNNKIAWKIHLSGFQWLETKQNCESYRYLFALSMWTSAKHTKPNEISLVNNVCFWFSGDDILTIRRTVNYVIQKLASHLFIDVNTANNDYTCNSIRQFYFISVSFIIKEITYLVFLLWFHLM